MAAGGPVVATPNPGANDILEGGRLGALANDADLGSTLLTLLKANHERDRLAALADKEVPRYAIQGVAARYEARYNA
jgi:hypothetical protein